MKEGSGRGDRPISVGEKCQRQFGMPGSYRRATTPPRIFRAWSARERQFSLIVKFRTAEPAKETFIIRKPRVRGATQNGGDGWHGCYTSPDEEKEREKEKEKENWSTFTI